jgi:hypothetical protein
MIIKGIYLLNVGYFYGPVTYYKIAAHISKSSRVPSYKSGCSSVFFLTHEQKLSYSCTEIREYPT